MSAIEAIDLIKRFGSINALNGISFQVNKGEILGFLGPNGAGKTTTVRILTGIIKPDSGSVIINGIDVVEKPLKAKEFCGVLPEVSNAYADLTAFQNMNIIAGLYGLEKRIAEKRIISLMKEFGIYERKDHIVRHFSKGMQQRLMLGMALVSDPEILFLDEPTSGLDVQSARMIREKILEIAGEGRTVFLTSHNMEEVNALCHRIGIINRGRIVMIGSPEQIKKRVGGDIAVEVSFNTQIDLDLCAERYGDKYVIYTRDPHQTVCEIVDYARRNGIEIVSLRTRTPTLEEAFLKILGVAE